MAEQPNSSPALGCLLMIGVALFIPAGVIATVIWPNQTANQFAGHTFLIGGLLVLAVIVIAIVVARGRR